mmetsp:Transcript_39788/g.110560  ORF Transcript_39788/g.110560 Transcript_39788/m.110560 type:complete len:253 (+) Transcript_39788:105-863(+)
MGGDDLARQAEEIDVLQSMYPGEGEFELLSDPPQAAAGKPVVLRIRMDGVAQGCAVQVTLPPGYPSEALPTFAIEGVRATEAGKLSAELADRIQDRLGEECIFDSLQAFEELAGEVLRQPDEQQPEGDQREDTSASGEGCGSRWAWAFPDGDDTLLRVSVTSGPKVRRTQITNLSELRRLAAAPCACIDIQPSRNTENYELASFLASSVGVPEASIDFVAGGKKEKASGDRQVRILGVQPDAVVLRILASGA